MNNLKAILSLVVRTLLKLLEWSLRGVFALTIFVSFMLIHLVVEITSDAYKGFKFVSTKIKSLLKPNFKVHSIKNKERN